MLRSNKKIHDRETMLDPEDDGGISNTNLKRFFYKHTINLAWSLEGFSFEPKLILNSMLDFKI